MQTATAATRARRAAEPNPVTDQLSNIFRSIANQGVKLDAVAATILAIVRDHRIATAADFRKHVSAAYAANGWHSGRGRPSAAASALQAVPRTVRTYVWEIHAALKSGLPVGKFSTLYELRQAMQAKRPPRAAHAPTLPELRGMHVSTPGKLTGALFHDLAVVYEALPADQHEAFNRHLQRLLNKYKFEVDLPGAAPAVLH